MVAKEVPDTTRKPEFTRPLLKAVLELHRLPPEADGKWGYQRLAAWQAVEVDSCSTAASSRKKWT